MAELLVTDKGKEKLQQKALSLQKSRKAIQNELNDLKKSLEVLVRKIALVERGVDKEYSQKRLDMALDLTEKDIREKEYKINQINIEINEYEIKSSLYKDMDTFEEKFDNADFLEKKGYVKQDY